MTFAVDLYEVGVALHVVAVVSAFGILLAWPLLPGGTAAAHRARARVLGVVVTRTATVGLVLGVALATHAELFGEPWVLAPLAILVLLLGVVGGYLTPAEQRLAALLRGGEPEAATIAARRRVHRAAVGCFALAALAAAIMVVKPDV